MIALSYFYSWRSPSFTCPWNIKIFLYFGPWPLALSSHPVLTFICSTDTQLLQILRPEYSSGIWPSTHPTLTDASTPSTQKIFPLLTSRGDLIVHSVLQKENPGHHSSLFLFFSDRIDHPALPVFGLYPHPFCSQILITSKGIDICASCVVFLNISPHVY